MAAKELQNLRALYDGFVRTDRMHYSRVVSDLSALTYCISGNVGTTCSMIAARKIFKELIANGRVTAREDGHISNDMLSDLHKRGLIIPFRKKPRQNREYGPGGTLARIIPLLRL